LLNSLKRLQVIGDVNTAQIKGYCGLPPEKKMFLTEAPKLLGQVINSPVLSLVDYSIWDTLQQLAYW